MSYVLFFLAGIHYSFAWILALDDDIEKWCPYAQLIASALFAIGGALA